VRRRALVPLVAVSAVVLDQAAKWVVRAAMLTPGTSIPVVGNLVRLTYTLNSGAAFGILPGSGAVFVVVTAVVLTAITVYTLRWKPNRLWLLVALGLVSGGAIGNLVDRLAFGLVTDFVQIPFGFPVFNVADSCVVVGIAMLVWWLLFGPTPDRAEECDPGAPVADDDPAGAGPSAPERS
jgi:signal peptidase II